MIDSEPCSVVDMEGDGNCFYRGVAVAMGIEEAAYRNINKLVHDFAITNILVVQNIANLRKLWQESSKRVRQHKIKIHNS